MDILAEQHLFAVRLGEKHQGAGGMPRSMDGGNFFSTQQKVGLFAGDFLVNRKRGDGRAIPAGGCYRVIPVFKILGIQLMGQGFT